MKKLLISIIFIGLLWFGWYRINHNLAYRMISEYPEIQQICDNAGGCWNVSITCYEYDNKGNSNLRNTSWWEITTGFLGEIDIGDEYGPTKDFDDHAAIKRAIVDYWKNCKFHQETNQGRKNPTIYPDSKPCDKDCWK